MRGVHSRNGRAGERQSWLGVCVGVLADELGLSPSLVSHHLRLLRAARLLAGRREGKRVFYAPADEHVRSVVRDMLDHVAEAG